MKFITIGYFPSILQIVIVKHSFLSLHLILFDMIKRDSKAELCPFFLMIYLIIFLDFID